MTGGEAENGASPAVAGQTPRWLSEHLPEEMWKGKHVVGMYPSGSYYVARLDRQMYDGRFDTTIIGAPMTKEEAETLCSDLGRFGEGLGFQSVWFEECETSGND